jgi:hypothetical protein
VDYMVDGGLRARAYFFIYIDLKNIYKNRHKLTILKTTFSNPLDEIQRKDIN